MYRKSLTLGALLLCCSVAVAAASDEKTDQKAADAPVVVPLQDESAISQNSVHIGGQSIGYTAVAGTLVVHTSDPDDTPADAKPEVRPAAAAQSYVAYFTGEGDGNERKSTRLNSSHECTSRMTSSA